jgi:pyrrolidone-carboxylate peptidase
MDGDKSVNIQQITPMSAATVGGVGVTIFGSGFQKGALVYFGSQLAEKTVVVDANIIETLLPASSEPGTVAVTVVNPDDSQAVQNIGFVYVSPQNSERAEVLGISPLTVIEGTETEVVLHGRNLIEAYENGLIALRGPSRVNLEISKVTTDAPEDDKSDIETVTYTLLVTATPALEPRERIAIQVLASRRPESRDDLIVENSKQMFVVLPRDVPVVLAQTPSLSTDKPTMVLVLGRNLNDCKLDFPEGITSHIQKSDEDSLYALVTVTEQSLGKGEDKFSILDEKGNPVGQCNFSLAPSAELKQSDPLPSESEPGPVAGYTVDLIQAPDQQFSGPTADDARVFDLKGNVQNDLSMESIANIGIIISYPIRFFIINRVYLFPLFDGGGQTIGSNVLAEVGKLFTLRGSAILVAARIEITIIVTVIIIITIDFPWFYGGFNEFPDQFPNAFGTIITGVIIDFEIILEIAFLNALVLPDGRLRLLFVFNLTIGIHFHISSDGFQLRFIWNTTHYVNYQNIFPFAEQFLCDGRFQLADDNGQTVFIDQFGGRRAFYFPRLTGDCCLPWTFNVELVKFIGNGPPQTAQPPFPGFYCLNAASSSNGYRRPYIWSEPPPTGMPLTLEMNLGSSAELVVLAEPVDENGDPTGPPVDIRTLDHGVEFHLEQPLEVLNPDTLPDGNADAIEEGDNKIIAAVTSVRVLDDETEVPPLFSFLPASIIGFNILRFLGLGESPRVQPEGLPVSVNFNLPPTDYAIEPKLAYERQVGNQTELVEVTKIERLEPHETPRKYVLAAKVTASLRTSDVTIKFTGVTFAMKSGTGNQPLRLPGSTQFPDGGELPSERQNLSDPKLFFSGALVAQTELTLNVGQNADLSKLIAFESSDLYPNLFEEVSTSGGTTTFVKVVPPGAKVTGSETRLNVRLPNAPTITSPTNSTATVGVTVTDFDFRVQNEEEYEEYYRVFYQMRSLLHPSIIPPGRAATLANFAQNFLRDLGTNGLNNLIAKGEELFSLGYEFVQQNQKDDRLLYYARLEAIAVLRTHYKRTNPNSTGLPSDALNKFEWASRGFQVVMVGTQVTVKVKFDQTTDRKVLLTGFDPFQLFLDPTISNTSAIATLALHKNFTGAQVRSVVMPVRWRDFDAGFIETIMGDAARETSLIMTCSWTPRYYFNIDRFASGYRAGSLDNEYKTSSNTNPTGGPSYIETSLPYECRDVFFNNQGHLNQQLSGGDHLVLNQSFSQSNPSGSASQPVHGQAGSYEKSTNVPSLSGVVQSGSGGSYLSNEIFYRTAKVRKEKQPGLLTGHFHIRPLTVSPNDYPTLPSGVPRTMTGDQIYQSVQDALTRFLNAVKRLAFPDTKVAAQSTANITLTNGGVSSVEITASNFISGLTVFQLTTALPVTIAAGANKTFEFKFLPVDAKRYTDTAELKDSNGKVIFCVQLEGKGIDPISSIPPSVAFPDTVINTQSSATARIKNLTANQPVTVKSAVLSAPFSQQNTLPVNIAPGAEVVFNLKFQPTAIGAATGNLELKDDSDNLLLTISLSGNGIAQPPVPIINDFMPRSGYAGESIMVTGANFIDVQEVKIGNGIVYHEMPISPTQIEIVAGATSGTIKIRTASGEGESDLAFFVRPIRNPPP